MFCKPSKQFCGGKRKTGSNVLSCILTVAVVHAVTLFPAVDDVPPVAMATPNLEQPDVHEWSQK